MRRPTLCCDHQSTTAIDEQTCKDQGGTLARVRRLLFSSSLGRKASLGGGSSSDLKPPPSSNEGRRFGGVGGSARIVPPPAPLRLNHSLGVVMEEMIGREMEQLLKAGGKTGNVPTFLHQITSYILNHDVNIAALLYEDFDCAEARENITNNSGQLRSRTVECEHVAQLLRYFVEELPSPLLPDSTLTSLVNLAEGHNLHHSPLSVGGKYQQQVEEEEAVVECKARKILHRDVDKLHIEVVRHLTEFLSCLHHANRCELEGASVLLSCALVGKRRSVGGKALGAYFLSHQGKIFSPAANKDANSSSSIDTHQQQLLRPSSPSSSSNNEEEGDESSSSTSSSRSSTSGDTEDYRSPVLSPNRLSDTCQEYELLPERGDLPSPEGEEVGDSSSSCGEEPLPTMEGTGDSMEEGGSSSSSTRSNNGDLSTLQPLSFLCDLKPDDQTLLCPAKENCTRTDDGGLESDGTSCGLSDPWEDFSCSPGGEVYSVGEEEPYPLHDNANLNQIIGESRRFSERNYYPSPRGKSTAGGDNSNSSPNHKKKRRHKKSHSKDAGALSSFTSSRERLSTTPSPTPHSEEDDVTIVANNEKQNTQNTLSSLLDHNEPVVACDRGGWGERHQDYTHRNLEFNSYSRYTEETEPPVCSSPPPSSSLPTPWSNLHHPEESIGRDNFSDRKSYNSRRYDNSSSHNPLNSPSCGSSSFMRAVTGKAAVSTLHKTISSHKKKIKRFEEEFEQNNGYKPSHSEKMRHKEIKKYMQDLSKYKKEMKMLKEGVTDLMQSKGFSMSLLRCQESTQSPSSLPLDSLPPSSPNKQSPPPAPSPSSIEHHQNTLFKVEEKLTEARIKDNRPPELLKMSMAQMQEEKTALQKALLYYESVHGRPSNREIRELARPLYDRYRQVKRNVTRAQSRAKDNMIELAPIIEHVAMDFTLASPQHRSSLIPGSEPMTELLECSERLMAVKRERDQLEAEGKRQEEEEEEEAQEGYQSDSSDMSKKSGSHNGSSTALSNLHSLPLHELRERRKEAKDQKKKLRKSLRQYEEKYEREHGHKLAKEDRGVMEQNYADYKHAKAKLRLLEALISKKAPKDYDF